MATTIRTRNARGEIVGVKILQGPPKKRDLWNYVGFDDPYHPVLSTVNTLEKLYDEYRFVHEQLALNETRAGFNLVDPETTRHILEGVPITRIVRAKSPTGKGYEKTTTISGWSGGHGNPEAAKFGKTQIPSYWTNERFMFEVSDVLASDSTRWFKQDSSPTFISKDDSVERYVCVEERYGVPIRVVADKVEDGFRCVTAFPDYSDFPIDQRSGVVKSEKNDAADERSRKSS